MSRARTLRRARTLQEASDELDDIKRRLHAAGLPATGSNIAALLSLAISSLVAGGMLRAHFMHMVGNAYDMATAELRGTSRGGDA